MTKVYNQDIDIFQKNGVVKIENFFKREDIQKCLSDYNQIVNSERSAEIYKDDPLVVLWTHVQGAQKKTCKLKEIPTFSDLIINKLVPYLSEFIQKAYPGIIKHRLQLLETIVFNKPPKLSNTLNWHQDVAYFPLKPNNQIAVWFPLSDVTSEVGPMVYAHKSHKMGIRGSINLHTREPFDGEDRKLIPKDPSELGLEVKEYEMTQKDLLIHDGYTWHYSKPNISNQPRMGVSVRFILEKSAFDPRPGQGAAFTKQINVEAGDFIESPCFPVFWEKSQKASLL